VLRAQNYRLTAILLGVELAISSLLRLVLCGVFGDHSTIRALPAILGYGLLFDALATIAAFLPLIAIDSLFRLRWLRAWPRRVVFAALSFALVFDAFVQYFFFDEYSARYNHLALDYVMYPDEVFGNILASYNVPLFAGLALAAAVALTWLLTRAPMPEPPPMPRRDRLAGLAMTAALTLALWGAWRMAPATVSPNRLTNELALNGWAELVRAFWTAGLDYEAYYALLPPDQAAARTARLIGQTDPRHGLVRHFTPRAPVATPRDVVIIIEESLGSEFSKRFGGPAADGVTPELDRWSHQGIAMTNLIANGNRTVRGMEGIIASFPPLPGDAIIKRDRSEGLATIGSVLAAHGYQTTFFYGGFGVFDNVKPFMTANGFQSFVEETDFPVETFRTIWGVADEFVFDKMIEQQLAAHQAGRPWLGAAMTVSNHKPFRWPAGRIEWPEAASKRHGAVLYADWALGHYLTRMQETGLLDHTVVLIAGDHGARVYGAEAIPVGSYRIPGVFLTPDARDRDTTIDRLSSQVDLAPTLLSLAGIEYSAPFFGRDVLGLPVDGGRAFVNHNRSVGLMTDHVMAVLGLHGSFNYYWRPDRKGNQFSDAQPSGEVMETARDAQAAFQVANQVYRDRQYGLPQQ
jgi:phosphoglycerol transferase MdoB-like AlkP superfamily enzyme